MLQKLKIKIKIRICETLNYLYSLGKFSCVLFPLTAFKEQLKCDKGIGLEKGDEVLRISSFVLGSKSGQISCPIRDCEIQKNKKR